MINKIFALPVIEQLTPVLSRRQLDDLDLIVVDHPQVKASFALQGAPPSLLETRWRGRGIVAQ